jgi:hypothetical protein
MDDILYLLHCTSKENYEKWDVLKPSELTIYQYPGVYFSLITKKNILSEKLYYSKYMLIFSKKLLEQQNYHINIQDYNGHINEKNTYYPWNLNKAINFINSDKYKNMNEVIFHDPIPMKYLCTAVITYEISSFVSNNDENSPHKYFKENDLLPKFPIYNEEEPDMTKIPFLCYPYEMNYNGVNPLKLSSKKFYNKMAKMCNVNGNVNGNVNINKSKIKIIEEIRTKIPLLIDNRRLLKIEEFK